MNEVDDYVELIGKGGGEGGTEEGRADKQRSFVSEEKREGREEG